MKEYIVPVCALIRTEPEDVIATSPIVSKGIFNLDDLGNDGYGKIVWNKGL